ncbi:MAG: hypothetical protein WC277_11600 [Bacilli bacterium]
MTRFVCHGCSDDCDVEKSEKHPTRCLRGDHGGPDFSDWQEVVPEPHIWVKIPADKIDYINVSRNHAPELGITGQYCPDIDTLPIDYETARQGIDILSKLKEASE